MAGGRRLRSGAEAASAKPRGEKKKIGKWCGKKRGL